MVGIGTVLSDDPKLTVRSVRGRSPVRLVVDSAARTPPTAALLTADERPPVIAVTEKAPDERVDALRRAGAEVWVLPAVGAGFVKPALAGFANPAPNGGGRVDLAALLRRLGEEQVQSVLVEGGGTLASAALAAVLVDRVYFFIAPLIIGGAEALTAVGGEGVARLSEAWRIRNMRVRRIGEGLLITGDVL